jgi:delta-aminolevulinic acid dehydratase/porphobilinogen synthase
MVIAESCAKARFINDESLELLARTALSQAAAGAHIVAPSANDGRTG